MNNAITATLSSKSPAHGPIIVRCSAEWIYGYTKGVYTLGSINPIRHYRNPNHRRHPNWRQKMIRVQKTAEQKVITIAVITLAVYVAVGWIWGRLLKTCDEEMQLPATTTTNTTNQSEDIK